MDLEEGKMISYYKRALKHEKIKKVSDFSKGCWINVCSPTDDDINRLVIKFDLDKQNLISGLDRNEVPRVEFDNKTVYIIIKVICSENPEEMHTFLIIIAEDFILTLSKIELNFIEKIIEGKINFITTQKLKCLLKLLSIINKDFEKSTLEIAKLVNSKKEAFSELSEKDLNELLKHESALNNFVSAYYYINLIYERVIKHIKFYEEDKEFLEDLTIEAKQGFDLSRSALKTISNIRDHHVILLSNKLNKVITILTVFTIFISVPAAIGGIYGMNVLLPMQQNPAVFGYIVGLIVVIWLGLILYLAKRKIL